MSDYDYLNARVRGQGRFLLGPEMYDQILRAEGEQIMLDVLMNSCYGPALAEALAAERGIAAIETALRRSLFESLDKLRAMAPAQPRKLIEIQLNRWDLANIVTIIRGKLSRASAADITAALAPAGQFNPVQLAELAGEPDLAGLCDSLLTWGYELAPMIRRTIRAQGPEVRLAQLESDLYIEFFIWAFSHLDARNPDEAILAGQLRLQVDLLNLLGALKLVEGRPGEPDRTRPAGIPGGTIGAPVLDGLADSPTVESALEALGKTAFAAGIERGILAFGQTNRLSALERFLEGVVIERGARLFRGDPLSAAVPIGFMWRKFSEYLNLRLILHGKRFRMPVNAVREALVLV